MAWDDPSAVPLTLTSLEPCENCDLAYEIKDSIGEILKTKDTGNIQDSVTPSEEENEGGNDRKNLMIGGKRGCLSNLLI